jgi:hypothetical protein
MFHVKHSQCFEWNTYNVTGSSGEVLQMSRDDVMCEAGVVSRVKRVQCYLWSIYSILCKAGTLFCVKHLRYYVWSRSSVMCSWSRALLRMTQGVVLFVKQTAVLCVKQGQRYVRSRDSVRKQMQCYMWGRDSVTYAEAAVLHMQQGQCYICSGSGVTYAAGPV